MNNQKPLLFVTIISIPSLAIAGGYIEHLETKLILAAACLLTLRELILQIVRKVEVGDTEKGRGRLRRLAAKVLRKRRKKNVTGASAQSESYSPTLLSSNKAGAPSLHPNEERNGKRNAERVG